MKLMYPRRFAADTLFRDRPATLVRFRADIFLFRCHDFIELRTCVLRISNWEFGR